MTYRVLSLFAGIGGFDLGLERTGGFRTVAVAEVDPYASQVLAKHFPGVPNVGDVTTAEYPHADFICAGFPCQDISFAGEGAGLAGARSGLWREVVRAIRVVGPRGTLLENVAALLNRGMGTVLGDLAEVGHDAEWHCIPASAVGAPHRRDRIWIYSHPNGEGEPAIAVDDEAPRLPRDPISGELARLLADTAGERRDRSWQGAELAGGCEPADCGEDVADTFGFGQSRSREPVVSSDPAAHSAREAGDALDGGVGSVWTAEPDVGRVAHGVPSRVDRLRCLGNAVVPQIPELIGRALLASERAAA